MKHKVPINPFVLGVVLLLSACSNKGRYQLDNDVAPVNAPNVAGVEDAHPRFEQISLQGNKDYRLNGHKYSVLRSSEGFQETGTASWYGQKFHGHLTSNGETYDMYSMSAAHKTLPLPSYVKVTNLDNNKSVVVRVNDRGPFHSGRVIDLSYAAAYRLDMLKTGTAKVKLTAIHLDSPKSLALAQLQQTDRHYIQVAASSNKDKIKLLAKELEDKYQVNARLVGQRQPYRLQLGPIKQANNATNLLQHLKQDGFPQSYLIKEE